MAAYNLALAFEAVVERAPDGLALRGPATGEWSYGALNALANQMARRLREHEVVAGDVVCISGVKTAQTYATMLGCLKLGAPYVMLDPDSPVQRLQRIVANCVPRLLLVDPQLHEKLKPHAATLHGRLLLSDPEQMRAQLRGHSSTNPPETRRLTGDAPSYVMYTSGSTGFPKGALMTHENVLHLISWSMDYFAFSPEDRLTHVNPLYFDNSVFDFYAALFSGATLVPLGSHLVQRPRDLLAAVDEQGCTSWFSVPSLLIYLATMRVLTRDCLRSVRRIIFGGEGYPKAKLQLLHELYGERAELINVYGPTECTCIASARRITAEDFTDLQGLPPLGLLADNFSQLILDPRGMRVAPGETGELCLLGPRVGKGYYNDPERTAEAFVQNPFNQRYAEIMYKSGDLVRLDPASGELHFVGRKDNQIKHMGYRIELEEIEAALSGLAYLSQAAVVHGELRGLSQIVAVVASGEGVSEGQIRDDLKSILPSYMLPTQIHLLPELPKNPNGKVDRRALQEAYLDTPEGAGRIG
jgi:D-alanine--poly(phosphoribitol) ligase subunit 1